VQLPVIQLSNMGQDVVLSTSEMHAQLNAVEAQLLGAQSLLHSMAAQIATVQHAHNRAPGTDVPAESHTELALNHPANQDVQVDETQSLELEAAGRLRNPECCQSDAEGSVSAHGSAQSQSAIGSSSCNDASVHSSCSSVSSFDISLLSELPLPSGQMSPPSVSTCSLLGRLEFASCSSNGSSSQLTPADATLLAESQHACSSVQSGDESGDNTSSDAGSVVDLEGTHSRDVPSAGEREHDGMRAQEAVGDVHMRVFNLRTWQLARSRDAPMGSEWPPALVLDTVLSTTSAGGAALRPRELHPESSLAAGTGTRSTRSTQVDGLLDRLVRGHLGAAAARPLSTERGMTSSSTADTSGGASPFPTSTPFHEFLLRSARMLLPVHMQTPPARVPISGGADGLVGTSPNLPWAPLPMLARPADQENMVHVVDGGYNERTFHRHLVGSPEEILGCAAKVPLRQVAESALFEMVRDLPGVNIEASIVQSVLDAMQGRATCCRMAAVWFPALPVEMGEAPDMIVDKQVTASLTGVKSGDVDMD
jgi:hypothetical protein